MKTLAALAALAFAAAAHADPVFIDSVAADGSGRIVAAVRGGLNNAPLAEWRDDGWVALPIRRDENFGEIREIVRLASGRLGILRWIRDDRWHFAELDGNQLVRPIPFSWPRRGSDFFALTPDSTGAVWLSGACGEVVHLANGRAETIPLARYAAQSFPNWNFVCVFEHPRGTVWIHTRDQASNAISLRRPLQWKNGELAEVEAWEGFGARGIHQILPAGENELWVLGNQRDLFRVRSGHAERVPFPERFGPDFLYPFGNGLLAIADDALWEFRDGKWTLRRAKDAIDNASHHILPGSAQLASGLLLIRERGLVFVPADGGPTVVLDWRRNFGMDQPSEITAVGADRFVAVSRRNGPVPWIIGSLADFPASAHLPVEEFRPQRGWAVDQEDRLAMIRERDSTNLEILDGSDWKSISLPENINHSLLSQLRVDARNRIWAAGRGDEAPIAILSADLQHWTTYKNTREATETEGDLTPDFGRRPQNSSPHVPLPPDFLPRNPRASSTKNDNAGFTWVAADGQLYKYFRGKTALILSKTQPHPFLDAPLLDLVRVDRHGATWFQRHDNHLIRLPPPEPQIKDLQIVVDGMGLTKVSADAAEGEWHWRPVGTEGWLQAPDGIVGYLPAGHQKIELVFVTATLDREGPFQQTVNIRTSPAKQTAHFLRTLSEGPDPARELVISAMTLNPERSIPVLAKALEQDGPHWWLEAALQACERQIRPATHPHK